MQHIIIGIPLPESVKKNLYLQCCGLSNANWIEAEQFHLCLIDIGKRSGPEVLDIINILQGIVLPPFTVALEGIASFSSGHGFQVIAAMAAISPPLNKLKSLIYSQFREEKIPIEPKAFHPHVSLGVLDPGNTTKTSQYLFENQTRPIGTFEASSFALFETRSTEKHTLCEILAEFPLNL